METAIIPLEMQSVGENDIFNAGEQKPNAKGTLTRLGTPSQQLTWSFTKSAMYKIILKTCFSKQCVFAPSFSKKEKKWKKEKQIQQQPCRIYSTVTHIFKLLQIYLRTEINKLQWVVGDPWFNSLIRTEGKMWPRIFHFYVRKLWCLKVTIPNQSSWTQEDCLQHMQIKVFIS